MNTFEILILAIGMCSDSFIISVCKGVTTNNKRKSAFLCSSFFTFFQVLFIIIGYYFGNFLNEPLKDIQNVIVFLIYFILAINILKEGFSEENSHTNEGLFSYIIPAISSSIDSLSVGFSFALYSEKITILLIFITPLTIFLSILGVFLGNKVGQKYKKILCFLSSLILLIFSIKFLIH